MQCADVTLSRNEKTWFNLAWATLKTACDAKTAVTCDAKIEEVKTLLGAVNTAVHRHHTSIIEEILLFKKVVQFGGVASGVCLVAFIGYLFILAVHALINYVKNKETEHAEQKAKDIDRAARRLYKKNSSSGSKSRRSRSREDVTLM